MPFLDNDRAGSHMDLDGMSFMITLNPLAVHRHASGSVVAPGVQGRFPASFGESILDATGVPSFASFGLKQA